MKLKLGTIKSLLLYNFRYKLAYLIVFAFGVYFLTWRLGSLLRGLNENELANVARTISLGSIFENPYFLLHSTLQWASLQIFEFGNAAARLPSVLLAAITTFMLYALLRKWFGKVTSLISITLLLSADWFLFIARSATGAIEFSLWFTLLIFSIIKLLERKYSWLFGYALAASMLLFVPFGVYAVITTTIGMLLCGVFKKRVFESPKSTLLISLSIFAVSIIAVAVFSFKNTEFLKTILGFSDIPDAWNYLKNLVLNTTSVVMIWPDNNPSIGPSGVFLIRFFEFVFMLFGLIMLWVTRVNKLNLIIIANAIVLALISGLSSGARGSGLFIVPAAIFMTAGIRHFIHRWEKTFPKNPYARIALLVPLAVLLITSTVLHYQSYFVLWPRQTATQQVFQDDTTLLLGELSKPGQCYILESPATIQKIVEKSKTNCDVEFLSELQNVSNIEQVRIISYRENAVPTDENRTTRPLVASTRDSNVRWVVSTVK